MKITLSKLTATTAAFLVIVTCGTGASGPAGQPYPPPVELHIPLPPSPASADGKIHLVYEVHATNFGSGHLQVAQFEAFDEATGAPLATYTGESSVAAVLRRLGQKPDEGQVDVLAPGRRGIFHVWITVEPDAVPERIRHRFSFVNDGPDGEVMRRELTAGTVTVAPPRLTIGPPLRGDNWLAANGPSNTSGHRRAMVARDGVGRIAQRWAVDWVQLKGDTTREGAAEDNSNYFAWGQDALAVADGVVASVKDGIPENVPGIDSRAVPITNDTIGGNYVILDVGDGNYAFYAHLQPGSLRVALGDRVKRGDVLGLVGNSGNSTEPHLHFHIADRDSPLGAEGLPYVFDAFDIVGTVADFGSPPQMHDSERRTNEIPLANVIVNFPE